MAKKITLETIAAKYAAIQHNDDNYSIGGGLDGAKFASRRHEDARNDAGKLTLGEATSLFKRATGLDTDAVREIIEYGVPNMEWHHAGKLPKSYGGGMKKTYFVNAVEIVMLATDWVALADRLAISKSDMKNAEQVRRDKEAARQQWLQANAIRFNRVTSTPKFAYETDREMNGKYGWFDCTNKSYNMPIYYSGWEFKSAEDRDLFYSMF